MAVIMVVRHANYCTNEVQIVFVFTVYAKIRSTLREIHNTHTNEQHSHRTS